MFCTFVLFRFSLFYFLSFFFRTNLFFFLPPPPFYLPVFLLISIFNSSFFFFRKNMVRCGRVPLLFRTPKRDYSRALQRSYYEKNRPAWNMYMLKRRKNQNRRSVIRKRRRLFRHVRRLVRFCATKFADFPSLVQDLL